MKLLLACNWKMNPAPKGFDAKDSPYRSSEFADVIVLPSFIDISACVKSGLVTGAQYGSIEENGAHTGDVSMNMLKSAGCTYVLCGHSERRQFHKETDADVAAQTNAVLKAGLIPIVCIGETAEERDGKKVRQVLERQLKDIPMDEEIILAYEPCWAIGTGKTPEPMEIEETALMIKNVLGRPAQRFLYGGSLDETNCKDILREPDVEGALIGGASLRPDKMKVILACTEALPEK